MKETTHHIIDILTAAARAVEAERRLAPLAAAADTLEWMEKHRAAVRALAEEAQRIQRDPLVAEVLARFGGEITEVRREG